MGNKDKKQVVIVAGANGSGKTTFARKFLDVTKYEFLNADEIAKAMSPEDPTKSRIAAGKQVINSIGQFIQEGKNFVIESTLSGSFLEKHIQKLKDNGYEINLTYVFLGSQDLCIERIKSRVRQGGHDVPDEDVVRRFNRGLVK
ncbi:MAG: AAA family ATPase, partial [Candidatus Melainabacteria bacterium]|nr:AAA family ATPase [Candidatus Melainabacteria bacterium]